MQSDAPLATGETLDRSLRLPSQSRGTRHDSDAAGEQAGDVSPALKVSSAKSPSGRLRAWIVGGSIVALALAATGVWGIMRGAITEEGVTVTAGEPTVELHHVRFFEGGASGGETEREDEEGDKTLYVLGELTNVGAGAVSEPRATVTLFDASGVLLDEALCAAHGVRELAPGESVPCFAELPEARRWTRYEVSAIGDAPSKSRRSADLDISDVVTRAPTARYAPHHVVGRVTNRSAFTARSVWVVVGLYDEVGGLVGAGRMSITGADLEPGATTGFDVSIFKVAGKPARSRTLVFGYDQAL